MVGLFSGSTMGANTVACSLLKSWSEGLHSTQRRLASQCQWELPRGQFAQHDLNHRNRFSHSATRGQKVQKQIASSERASLSLLCDLVIDKRKASLNYLVIKIDLDIVANGVI